jgi:RluA family pseudouridine synthase
VPLTNLKLITTVEHDCQRLDDTLAAWLTGKLHRPVSKAKVRKLVMAGAISVDGRRIKTASLSLSKGTTIDARIDTARLFADLTSRDRAFELTPRTILFEDEDLIVVDKPPALPSQPTVDGARDNLLAAVTRFLSKRKTSQPYVGVHHRLDRDTSGIVLFTKSKRVNAAVGEIFSSHRGVKIYQAITAPGRTPKQEWTIQNQLGLVASPSKRRKYGVVPTGGDSAQTAFRTLARYSKGLWIEAIPKTGRTHQIRVHLSEYGLPILGDDLYGVSEGIRPLASRLMLHATQLTFPHPISGLELNIKSPLPDDFVRCLDRLNRNYAD